MRRTKGAWLRGWFVFVAITVSVSAISFTFGKPFDPGFIGFGAGLGAFMAIALVLSGNLNTAWRPRIARPARRYEYFRAAGYVLLGTGYLMLMALLSGPPITPVNVMIWLALVLAAAVISLFTGHFRKRRDREDEADSEAD